MEQVYLIECNPSNHTYISSLLDDKYITSKMRNFDETFDYIIKCDQEFASSLKLKGVHIIADRNIIYDM